MLKKSGLSQKKRTLMSLVMGAVFFSNSSFADSYIDSAKDYLAENKVNSAIIELKNAIKKSPEDGYARFLLGKIFFQQGDFALAEQQLYQAFKYEHDRDVVASLIAQSLINQSKFEDAFLFINDSYPTTAAMPTDLLALSAIAEIKLNNLSSAKVILEKIKEKSLHTEIAKATYAFATKELDKALAIVNELVKTYNKESELWLLKGHIETSLHNHNTAYDNYLKAYELAPKSLKYTFHIARSLVQLKRFDEATPLIDNLLRINAQNALVNELKAIILFSAQNFKAAKLHADRAINNGRNTLRLSAISGISAFQLNQYEHSYKTFKSLIPKLPSDHIVNRLYIINLFKLGHVDEAIENLQKFKVTSASDSEFLTHVSVELTRIGRNDLALDIAQKAAVKAKEGTETLLNFVKLANDDPSGMDNLLDTIDNQSTSSIRVKQGVANYYLMKGKFDEAQKMADEWLKTMPDDTVALAIKGLISKQKNEMELAKSYFDKVLALEPNNLQARIELAKIESHNGNTEAALAILKTAKMLDPDNHQVNKVFLEHYMKSDRFAEAIKIIDEQIKDAPLNTQLQIQKADALIMQGEINSAIILLESLASKNKRVWRTLASLYTSLNDKTNQTRSFAGWLEVDQYNPVAYLYNIRHLLNENALAQSMKVTLAAQEIFPDDVRFMLGKAETLLKQGKIQDATIAFNNIPATAEKNAEYHRVQGLIQLANKEFAAATKTYVRLFELVPSSRSALELASVYLLNDQKAEAITFLDDLITRHSGSTHKDLLRLKIFLAELTLNEAPEKSIALYTDVVALQPNNVVALNNLSWLLFQQDKIAQACSIGEKAHNLASENINIADTYGYCLLKNGELNKSLTLLEFAHNSRQDDVKIALHFAEALIEAKQLNKAGNILANIVTSSPDLLASKNSLQKTVVSLTQ